MPAVRNLAGNADFQLCDLRPECLSVIHGNLKSPTSIRTPEKFPAFRCNTTPNHRLRCRIMVFSHVASSELTCYPV